MTYLFSTYTVSDLSGASFRQIDHWARIGLLKPSAKDAAGKGTRRRYTFLDVVAVKTVVALRECGCPLQKVRAAVRQLRKEFPDESNARKLARTTLLTDGKQVYMLTNQKEIMEVISHQHVWSVALGYLFREVQEQVEAMSTKWTESVRVAGRQYHLNIVRDGDTGTFTVLCKELPGAIEQGDTAEEAIENGKDAIRSVLAFMSKRRSAGARYVQAG